MTYDEPSIESTLVEPLPLSVPRRIRWFLGGVLYPVIALVMVAVDHSIATPAQMWQDGQWSTWYALMLDPRVHWPAYPWLLVSTIALMCLLIRSRSGDHVIVRVGVFTGVVWSIAFVVILMGATSIISWFMAAIVAVVQFGLIEAARRVRRRFSIRDLVVATLIAALIFTGLSLRGLRGEQLAWLFLPVFLVGGAAGPLAMLTYVQAAFWLINRHRTGMTAWWFDAAVGLVPAAGGVGSGYAISRYADAAYAALPTTQPQCFVVTAASRGHSRWVGCRIDGGVRYSNAQLIHLKQFERDLMTDYPRIHHRLRRVYDRVGPPLAHIISRSMWFADVAYVILKPIEWTAVVWLSIRRSSVGGDQIKVNQVAAAGSTGTVEIHGDRAHCIDRRQLNLDRWR